MLVNLLLLGIGIEHGHQRSEDVGNLGLVYAEGIDNRVDIPYEDTCIPIVVVLADILLGCFHIGLLLEGVYAENLLV